MLGDDRREVVAIRVVAGGIVQDVRLLQLLPVAVHHPVAKVDVVAGNADDALHHIQARFRRREKDDDIAALNLPVRDHRARPPGFRGQGHAVDEDVVADEQGVLHRAGGDLEGLQVEGDDEQPDHQHQGHRGDELGGGLALSFPAWANRSCGPIVFLEPPAIVRCETCGPSACPAAGGSRHTGKWKVYHPGCRNLRPPSRGARTDQ